jgi:hypothetical protein
MSNNELRKKRIYRKENGYSVLKTLRLRRQLGDNINMEAW